MMCRRIAGLSLLFCLVLSAVSSAAEPPSADSYLREGRLKEGVQALAARLKAHPDDDGLRYSLGVVQFVRAVEHLSQSLYRYGLRSDRGRHLEMPFLRLPIPRNPHPEMIDYLAVRRILQELINDLRTAEATLAGVRDPAVKVPVHVGLICMDLDGSGTAGVPMRKLLAQYFGGERNLPEDPEILVVFDRADVAWFRGYSHLLMAQAEIVLAHGGQELFECTAHLFFARPITPHGFLLKSKGDDFYRLGDGVDAVDVIALVHLIRLPLKDRARMTAALGHLQKTIALSRETWRFVMADTGDDHKWIPNPRQTGVLGVKVTDEMVSGWLAFLDESQAILEGRRLVPFWRKGEERGVNLRRVFTEPRPFDLVLWVQGTAATPYLEDGPMTPVETWRRLMRVFHGEFLGFAIWFN